MTLHYIEVIIRKKEKSMGLTDALAHHILF